jgi:hypothetical protein
VWEQTIAPGVFLHNWLPIEHLLDHRKGTNIQYRIQDAALEAFRHLLHPTSVFFGLSEKLRPHSGVIMLSGN